MSNLGWKPGKRYKSRFKVGDRVKAFHSNQGTGGVVVEVFEPLMTRSSRNSASVKIRWDNLTQLSVLPQGLVEKDSE